MNITVAHSNRFAVGDTVIIPTSPPQWPEPYEPSRKSYIVKIDRENSIITVDYGWRGWLRLQLASLGIWLTRMPPPWEYM